MHHGRPAAARRDGARTGQEGGLGPVAFVGSFPAPDFPLPTPDPEVAFLGRSNVGKSSLINAVVGRRALARTSRTPGRTRACNVFRVAERYYLVDLPGYGYARLAGAERRRLGQLIDAYLANRRSLAGVVWLLDMRHDPSVDDARAARNLVTHGRPVLVALTKADKVPRGRRPERIAAIGKAVGIPEDQCVVTSARTREGIAELRDAINGLVAP